MREMFSCDLETENQLSAPFPAFAELSMVDHWFHEEHSQVGRVLVLYDWVLRGLSATRFCLEFVDFLRGLRFGQVLVKLLASLTAKGPEIGNLRPRHRFLTGDPLLGRLFGIWSGIGIHASKFAPRCCKGLQALELAISTRRATDRTSRPQG